MCDITKNHLQDTQDIINKCIWNNKPVKVAKHLTLVSKFTKGGLKGRALHDKIRCSSFFIFQYYSSSASSCIDHG